MSVQTLAQAPMLLIVALSLACGPAMTTGGGGGPGLIAVSIDPVAPSVQAAGTVNFVASVAGSSDGAVSWTIQEGASGGTLSASGSSALYTAPTVPGSYHVVATSMADASKTGVAAVTVTQGLPPRVTVAPASIGVVTNQKVQFSATVTGMANTAVSWKVQEGSAGGVVDGTGLYTAPSTGGTFHVVATSSGNPSLSAQAVATVTGSPSGTAGVWQNVTPAGVNIGGSGDNFGVQDVLVDPARPSDVYTFITRQGVWKSTDAGATWNKISANGGPMDQGKPWGEAIDPNPNRNPSVPPTMYGTQGNSSDQGILKSTDGGATWTQVYKDPGGYGRDVYDMDIDPNDSQHLIATFHDSSKIVESTDGGKTWMGRGAVGGATLSSYVFFVTSSAWLMVSQWTDANGTWRTENSGASWSKVSNNEHFHGNCQIYVGPAGVVYLPGAHGIERSADYGKTWTSVYGSPENSVVATASFLYANDGWATQGTWDANLIRSPVASGTTWGSYTTKPANMSNGAKRAAVAFDGSHYVIISGNWNAGLWRYVEN